MESEPYMRGKSQRNKQFTCQVWAMIDLKRQRSIWFGEPKEEAESHSDPRIKHEVETLKSNAALYLLAGLTIIFIIPPVLVLPSKLGFIPYQYCAEFLDASWITQYLLALLFVVTSFTPVSSPWDLPIPELQSIGWRIAIPLLYITSLIIAGKFIRDGREIANDNIRILNRKQQSK